MINFIQARRQEPQRSGVAVVLTLLILGIFAHIGVSQNLIEQFMGWWRGPYLTSISGQVLFVSGGNTRNKRVIKSAALPLSVHKGNIIEVAPRGQAQVACGSGKILRWKQGRHTVDCSEPTRSDEGQLPGWNHGRTAAQGPLHILWPRHTALLNPTPTLCWTPVEGITPYRVTLLTFEDLSGKATPVWSREVASGTQLQYPAGVEPLQTGNHYLFQVERSGWNTRSTDKDPFVDGFTLASPQTAAAVDETTKRLRDAHLSAPEHVWMLSALYEANDLNAEALQNLAPLTPTIAKWRLTGDLYSKIGLPDEARKSYEQALKSAQEANDGDEVADANWRLGHLLASVPSTPDDLHQAKSYLESARDFARHNGDSSRLTLIENELTNLSATHGNYP